MKGTRVHLRPFEPGDFDALFEIVNHPDLDGRRYLPDDRPGVPVTGAQMRAILEKWAETRRRIHLAVSHNQTGDLIGYASAFWGWDSLCPDVQVVISPEFQRHGFGTEALTLLIDWVFDSLPAHNISCWVQDWNSPAFAFLEKMGFKSAGFSRREAYFRGRYVDEGAMEILRPEWEARHGA